jgi:hypothetical protein
MNSTRDEGLPQPDRLDSSSQGQPAMIEEHLSLNPTQRFPTAARAGEDNLSRQRIDANDLSHGHPELAAAQRGSSGATNRGLSNNAHVPREPSVEPAQLPTNFDRDHEHFDRSAAMSQRDGDGAPTSLLTKVKGLWQSFLDYMQDSWFLEIAACALALALLATEIGVLSAFNGRDIYSWPWRWSLNSAVALVTAILESSLLFAIVSCLGQMKWLWFCSNKEEEKRLIWIDHIARSNTFIGALSLMFLHATTWR